MSGERPIGVFDSGIGGLTVVQEIRRLMPGESIIYVGDTARAPYGGKDAETLISHGREIIKFLISKDVKAVVMACGTSSSTSYEILQKEFNITIIDTIRPAVSELVRMAQLQKIKPVFTATSATIKSGLFARLFSEKCKDVELVSRACPLFAPMVEAGLSTDNPLLQFAADNYLSDLRGKVDTLVLGCTHYPLVQGALVRTLGEITFINPATATAIATKDAITPSRDKKADIVYYTSGDTESFSELARIVLKDYSLTCSKQSRITSFIAGLK
ncbi:MAG: glutamate racemase [Defluviitaleaceae bacterium]|nr:glutamate racemase [Defluviitaleaceae bacterium]